MMTYIRTYVTTNMPNDIIHNLEDTTVPSSKPVRHPSESYYEIIAASWSVLDDAIVT